MGKFMFGVIKDSGHLNRPRRLLLAEPCLAKLKALKQKGESFNH
jgi:hypothetical protein